MRSIDTGTGQACKANETGIDLYSKDGADTLFLDQTEADVLYLGKTAKAGDSDRLDGQDSLRYLKSLDARHGTDFARLADGVTTQVGHPAEGSYPGLSLALTCDVDGGSTLVATSQEPFTWWWDDTFGSTPAGAPPYGQAFPIGDGVERHELRSVFTRAWYTTTFDLDTSIGFDPRIEADVCTVGWTLLKAANVSAGP